MNKVATQRQYTPKDLLALPDGDRYELVDGQLVERAMSLWASYIVGRLTHLLSSFCEQSQRGWVLAAEASYQCFSDAPDKVRRPDLSFIRLDRLPVDQAQEEGHIRIAPDLVIEVLSPNDLVYQVDRKVQEYLAAGVRLVWVVHPASRTIDVFRTAGPGTILREPEELTGEDVLPGFHCRVSELFQPPPGAAPAAPPGN